MAYDALVLATSSANVRFSDLGTRDWNMGRVEYSVVAPLSARDTA